MVIFDRMDGVEGAGATRGGLVPGGGAAPTRGGRGGGTPVSGPREVVRGGGVARGGSGSAGQPGGGGSAGRSFDRPVDASPLLRFRAPDNGAHEVREKYVNIYFIWVYYKLSISISKISHKVLKILK